MNNLCCWLVTCRPGNSVLVTVVEKPIWPAHAAASRRRSIPTSAVGLTDGRISPAFGQSNRPSVRVADRPSDLSRKNEGQCLPVTMGHLGDQALPAGTAPMRARHVGLHPGL